MPEVTNPRRQQFAARLHELCTEMRLPQRGRQTRLAELFKVSQQAAKKWLDGESYPAMETIVAIADWGNVNVNWLLQGHYPKRGEFVDSKAIVLDEAIQSLPPELGADLIDNLRVKLERANRVTASELLPRFQTMLAAYEHWLTHRRR